ncbi:beta-L-arabinofuranosidase domain-containing protein [Flavobacterium akiainvivens]|uniref:beta-L-arabinofuranosidase domain-containing protein n=1 Tax=Flavobacterium akiainvivens TaxID=1202724 RepID=UPI0006C83EEB|nr:beta-L-arabinofuranosidase domain-containing protein [Flavobacterium akiainvivens]SFQ77171.1 hypothetical protein SAMN05444144_12525 [Flavobacterium akiainvivens]
MHIFRKYALLLIAVFAQAQTTPQLSVSINHYDKVTHILNDKATVTGLTAANLKLQSSVWQVSGRAISVKGNATAKDVSVTFTCTSGTVENASVSVHLDFEGWSQANYVLMPAAVYNGNRAEVRNIGYCPFVNDVADLGPDKPQLITDVPRLGNTPGTWRIQQRTGDMSTPGIGFYTPGARRSFIMLTPQGTPFGDSGIDIEENTAENRAAITYTAPVVREQYRYFIANAHVPSTDEGATFKAGDSVTLTFRMYDSKCKSIQELFGQFATTRNDVVPHPEPAPNFRSFSTAFGIIEDKFNTKNFVPEFGYYAVGLRENPCQDWQIGWVGGMISTYPLLYDGNETSVQNVIRNFDWLLPNGISPSGFFWDTGEKGNVWMGIFRDISLAKNLHLVRKSGDGLYYCLKQFYLMEQKGIPVKQPWKEGCKTVADRFVANWKKYGQFGQFVDNYTGEVVIGGSASGGIVPAALILAYQYYGNPEYLNVAKEAAAYYNDNFVTKGVIYGGPGDAMQNYDSEATYGLLESYTVLYEATGDKKWLAVAETVAQQFATWVTGYDYAFPPDSDLGRINARTTGTVWANTQNKHAAPGICTHSGVALLKLYRATGNAFYLDLLNDISHTLPQYVSTDERPIGRLENGWVSERVSTTDWLEGIGQLCVGTSWAETSVILTNTEVPGIYIDLEKNTIAVNDHVGVRVLSQAKSVFEIELKNPTDAAVIIKVLAERSRDKKVPLGNLPLVKAKVVRLQPGATQVLQYEK